MPEMHIKQILSTLKKLYPEAKTALNFQTPYQLLVATILSAQCTDERVNQVTAELFSKCPDVQRMSKLSLGELQTLIRPTGFYRNKAKNILTTSKALVSNHKGKVPNDMEVLLELPGIGRKTANVILNNAYDIPSGVVVDTHVGRVSYRLGLTNHKNPVKIETDLMNIVPQKDWIMFSHVLIFHGRKICKARRPQCHKCSLNKSCPKVGVKA